MKPLVRRIPLPDLCYGSTNPLCLAASVDYETDKKIQDTIAAEFDDRTILCIARRFPIFLLMIGYPSDG